MRVIDYVVTTVFLVGMVIMYYLGNCNLDIWVLLLGVIIASIVIITSIKQDKKHKDLNDELERFEETEFN